MPRLRTQCVGMLAFVAAAARQCLGVSMSQIVSGQQAVRCQQAPTWPGPTSHTPPPGIFSAASTCNGSQSQQLTVTPTVCLLRQGSSENVTQHAAAGEPY